MIEPSAVLAIYRSSDPSSTFRSVVECVTGAVELRSAIYLDVNDASVVHAWPGQAELTNDLVDTILHVLRVEVFPIGSEFPFDAERFPDAEMLLLPIEGEGRKVGVCVLIAGSGSFGEDLEPWMPLATAIADAEERRRQTAELVERCDELRRRVEETEALHSLGLTVNRTLHSAEVLNLVARFTRSLLGAHYVTVNTTTAGRVHTVASVGLHDILQGEEDYHLARAVVRAARSLVVGGPGDGLEVANFPYHQAQGMRTGMGIPLTLFGDTFGALVVGYRMEYEITAHDTRLARVLAGHAAVAISNARLHESVEQRSRDLERAYAELDELSRSKERFFASINHELRNPLGAVLGYQTLALEDAEALPPTVRNFLEKANRAAGTLRVLVDDLLDLSKLAAGKMELDVRRCTLREILDGALNTIQPLADGKGLPLRVEAYDHEATLRTDARRVQQILVNLLSNAVKFTSRGEVRLEVRRSGADPGSAAGAAGEQTGSWVDFRVIDSGPGIPEEDRARVFEEFEQVKGTRGGTGLGLPIARRLARLLNGDLDLESELGSGSVFVLRLPASLDAPTEVAGEKQQVSTP